MIKLKILRWGDHPRLAGWVQCNHREYFLFMVRGTCIYGKKAQRNAISLALKVGAEGHEPRNVNGLYKLDRQGNGFSPTVSRRECSPADT